MVEESKGSARGTAAESQPNQDELLPDPLNDRQMNDVPRPPNKRLSLDRIYPLNASGLRAQAPDHELIRNYQYVNGKLSKQAFLIVTNMAKQIMSREPNILRVDGQVVIFGDIHGQYYDLCEVLRRQKFGRTSKKFLFLGDYVDRGTYGPQVIAYLFAMKIRFPDQVYLVRGNHETRECT